MGALALPVDRVTALVGERPETARIDLHGVVTTSHDGSVFDAASLFDLAAGGLRVVGSSGDAYTVASTGETTNACTAAGASSPCLVPRLAILANERLMTAGELRATLSGAVELTGAEPLPPPAFGARVAAGVAGVVVALVAIAIAWAALVVLRRRSASALGRIRREARRALRATAGDVMLERARGVIRQLVARAAEVDAGRRGAGRALARIDRAVLARRAFAYGRSKAAGVAGAADVVAALAVEQAEVARLDAAYAAAVAELERIDAALRAAALRARSRGPGVKARVAGPRPADPVDLLGAELDLRDEALVEAEAAS